MERYERLQGLLAGIKLHFCGGSAAELARQINQSDSYINRLFYPKEKNGSKGVGPSIMDACTARFELPRGFWDMEPGEAFRELEDGAGGSVQIGQVEPVAQFGALRPAKGGTVVIPQYDVAASMGRGVRLQDQPGIIRSIEVSQEWASKNLPSYTNFSNLGIVTGFGDSMRGMFEPGDPILVDTGIRCCDHDGVFFFRLGDEGFIKQLQRFPQKDGSVLIRAKSKNPEYEPMEFDKSWDFEVFAKVLIAWRRTVY